jgi:hypothetical protein
VKQVRDRCNRRGTGETGRCSTSEAGAGTVGGGWGDEEGEDEAGKGQV